MPTIDFLPVAISGAADVDTQPTYAGSSYQLNGFVNGVALPNQCNKVWRQGTVMASVVANFIAAVLGVDVLDNGDTATLLANLLNAIQQAGSVKSGQVVAFTASPTFNAALYSVFEITLTNNCTPTVAGGVPFQMITFVVHQDGTGGHTFVPASVPSGDVDTDAGSTTIQSFIMDHSNVWHPFTPPMVG